MSWSTEAETCTWHENRHLCMNSCIIIRDFLYQWTGLSHTRISYISHFLLLTYVAFYVWWTNSRTVTRTNTHSKSMYVKNIVPFARFDIILFPIFEFLHLILYSSFNFRLSTLWHFVTYLHFLISYYYTLIFLPDFIYIIH